MTTSPDATAKIIGEERPLTRWERRGAVAGAAVLALTLATCVAIPSSVVHFGRISGDKFYRQQMLRLDTILAGVFAGAYLLAPAAAAGYMAP